MRRGVRRPHRPHIREKPQPRSVKDRTDGLRKSKGPPVSTSALPDLVVEAEDRQVHRHHDEADDAADEDDHERLDQGGQGLDLGVDLGLLEVGDLASIVSLA
jgi:hypothetical protein